VHLVPAPSILEILGTSAWGYVLAVWMGLLWGSFANVCIYRWPPTDEHPKGRSVVAPGSHCSACKTPIRWYDNVPLLSYLWLRGRCRSCKATFSPRYLLVEALTGALFGVAWWFTMGEGGMFLGPFDVRMLHFVIFAAFVFAMVVITFIDIDHMLILDKLTFPSIALAYGASLVLHRPWWHGLVGIGIGYGVPWAIGTLYHLIRKREGLGLGDAKLLAVVGALLGWKGVVVSLFGGSLLGSVIGILSLARSKGDVMRTEIPFGPFLAAAAVVYLFAEPWVSLYSRLL
jgi:leader peptidase (prepilin peptidase) / N-methyltransferase